MTLVQIAPIKIFQLTPSRRATITGRRPYLILKFQLTPSRRATEIDKVYQKCMEISTHALTEGDPPLFVEVSGYENFNSRPHGGRPNSIPKMIGNEEFQLTPSRRATSQAGIPDVMFIFQLTPSRRATANLDKFFF